MIRRRDSGKRSWISWISRKPTDITRHLFYLRGVMVSWNCSEGRVRYGRAKPAQENAQQLVRARARYHTSSCRLWILSVPLTQFDRTAERERGITSTSTTTTRSTSTSTGTLTRSRPRNIRATKTWTDEHEIGRQDGIGEVAKV